MNDLIHSYRALPTLPKVAIAGAAVVAALIVLALLPHIVGAVVGVALALLGFLFTVAVIAAVGVGIYMLIKMATSR
jgi:hypothetical protein